MKILFLGTGASGGTPGNGKSKRKESSVLIQNATTVLVDVTRHFSDQVKNIKDLDCILLTHAHMDASGGIKQLDNLLRRENMPPLSVYAHPKTITVIKARYKLLTHCRFIEVMENQSITENSCEIIPLEVPHSQNPKFPTYAWKLRGNKTIVYASDIAELTQRFKKFCKGINLLIIDGATWRRTIFSHLRTDKSLPKLCKWDVTKIILTQIGKSAPQHEIFEKKVKEICPKAIPSFDGLKISL